MDLFGWFARRVFVLVTTLLLVALVGATDLLAAPRAANATTWYFAEGFTGPGFDEYLTFLNVGAVGTATITYYVEGQPTPTTRTVPLSPNSRTTVVVHQAQSVVNPGGLGRLSAGHSTKVESSVPVVVERPMYFTYNSEINGGHNVLGATALASAWYFAEGYTGPGFDEYLTIMNPGAAGSATITYYIEGQTTPTTRTVPLPATSRTTITVHADQSAGNPGGLGRLSAGHSTKVETTVPTVVERPMYFVYTSTINGGHTVLGAVAPATAWYFAEGFTGPGFQEYLTIQNPGATSSATVTYYVEGQTTPTTRTVPLAANSRTTVAVHAGQSAGNPGGLGAINAGHSAKVESATPIVVERPMYFSYTGAINDGHNVLGASAPATAWFFAEGFTGAGFDEYLTIQNPGAAGVALITYYVEGQTTPTTRNVPLAANSRTTVAVHIAQSVANPGGLGPLSVGHATKVEASIPVVVERPMYFTYNGRVNGGHNMLGASGIAMTLDRYRTAVLDDTPASYWRLGEASGTTAVDEKGAAAGTYVGTLTLGQPGALAGNLNTALAMDGGFVSLGDRYDFVGTTAFTLEAWLYPTAVDPTAYRRIISKEGSNGAGRQGYALGYHATNGIFCGRYAGASMAEVAALPGPNLNSWVHIACVYDGTTLRLYRNGVLAGTAASLFALPDTTETLTLGNLSTGGSWVTGRLDEIAIYPAALSATRVRAHYDAAR